MNNFKCPKCESQKSLGYKDSELEQSLLRNYIDLNQDLLDEIDKNAQLKENLKTLEARCLKLEFERRQLADMMKKHLNELESVLAAHKPLTKLSNNG